MESLVRKQLLVYLKKNNDYGDSFLHSLERYGVLAFIIRAEDKISRLDSLINSAQAEVTDEKVEDTILDLLNYSVLCKVWEYTHEHKVTDIAIGIHNFVVDDGVRFVDYLISIGLLDEDSYLIAVIQEYLNKMIM